MPKDPSKIPTYRLHKPTGQGVVTLGGRDIYLGKHDSPESHEKYRRVIAEWLNLKPICPRGQMNESPTPALTVAELLLAFWKHAQTHYKLPGGKLSEEVGNFKATIKPIRLLYGMRPAAEFGPLALRAVQDQMVRDGLARPTINARINRVRFMFKWAASLELIPVAVPLALKTVPPLQKGRTHAREPKAVGPVSVVDVEKTLPFLTRPIAGLVRLQLLTGMRPGEACSIRGCDIDKDGATWTYRPASHKTAWRGKTREVIVGPKAQAILTEFAKIDPVAYLFDPREAAPLNIKKPSRGSRAKAPDGKATRATRTEPGQSRRYHRDTYLHAISRACDKAGVPSWTPNQLRHNAATEIRARFGLEAAQAILGHSRADVTQLYAERDLSKAREVMGQVG